MARLLKNPYPLAEIDYNKPYPESNKQHEADLDAIDSDMIYSYPVADGRALYLIVKIQPPTLQHIPYSDAWELPAAHIRGLTSEDLKDAIQRNKQMKKLFGGNNGE